MKKLTTMFCCIALAVFGWVVGMNNKPIALPTQTISAAQIPLDLRLGHAETIRDTVYTPRDTVYVPQEIVVVAKTEKVPVPYKVIEHDTLYASYFIDLTQVGRLYTMAEQDTASEAVTPARNDNVQLNE